MKYTTLIFKNRFLTIKQTLYNSKILISDLIDSCNRLAKELALRPIMKSVVHYRVSNGTYMLYGYTHLHSDTGKL